MIAVLVARAACATAWRNALGTASVALRVASKNDNAALGLAMDQVVARVTAPETFQVMDGATSSPTLPVMGFQSETKTVAE